MTIVREPSVKELEVRSLLDKGMKQSEVARLAGVSRQYVFKIKNAEEDEVVPEFNGTLLRELRTSKGWTSEDVAKKLRTTHAVVTRWETNTHKPRPKSLVRIARLFGLKIDDFLIKEEA